MGTNTILETDPLPDSSDPDGDPPAAKTPGSRRQCLDKSQSEHVSMCPPASFLRDGKRSTNPELVVGGNRRSAKTHYGSTSAAARRGGLSKFPELSPGSCATRHNTEIEEESSFEQICPSCSSLASCLLDELHDQTLARSSIVKFHIAYCLEHLQMETTEAKRGQVAW